MKGRSLIFVLFSLLSALACLVIFSPIPVAAKGGDFHIEVVTSDGFGNSANFDLNDGLEFDSYFYVTSDTIGDVGRIYRSSSGNAGTWSQAAAEGFGDSNNSAVDAMIEFENNLYVTTSNPSDGAEMWRSADGSNWTAVVGGGAATNNGFGDANNGIIRETAVFDDAALGDQYLWAFTDNDTDGTEFWRSTDGTTWNETTEPAFTDATETAVVQGFEFNSRLYIFVLDDNDAEGSADDVEVWYTTGGATPAWTLLNTASFQNLVDDAIYLFFTQHGGSLYVGNINNTADSEIWVSADGLDFTLSQAFTGSYGSYPASTSKGLIGGIVYETASENEVRLYLYSGGSWVNTAITVTCPDFFFSGSAEFGDYYYAWGGVPGMLLRADLRPTASAPSSSQTQLGDGVVEITFTVGDIADSDTLRARVEYDIGDGYQKATLSEDASDISATYGSPDVENDNNYQIGNASGWITTSSGANTVTVKWLSKTDEPTSNTTNATIRLNVSDGTTSGAQKTESSVTVDNVVPEITSINLTEGQTVSTNPYVIRAQASDSTAGMWKMEFYVDDNLVCTDEVADDAGDYTCDWDTDQYRSDVRVVAYDQVGNTSQQVLGTTVLRLAESGVLIRNSQAIGILLMLPYILLTISSIIAKPSHSPSLRWNGYGYYIRLPQGI